MSDDHALFANKIESVRLELDDGELAETDETRYLKNDVKEYQCECGKTFLSRSEAREHLEEVQLDRVYKAVYKEMYEMVRDPRPIMFQMDMRRGIHCIGPREAIEHHADTDAEWSVDDAAKIARHLLQSWVDTYNDYEETYDNRDVDEYDGLETIIAQVEE